MNDFFLILKTEIKQNKTHFSLISAISIILGISFVLAISANNKISSLSQPTQWNAELAVLPKGISLSDFKDEILSGKTTALLPEALFDTTVNLAQDSFQLTAYLALADSLGPSLMIKNANKQIDLPWAKEKVIFKQWATQNVYSTNEWGNKVITGFLATGNHQAMNKLKELIDKKTVAQAIFINSQIEKDRNHQLELRQALIIYSGVLLILITLSLLALYYWIKSRIENSFTVFLEIGYPTNYRSKLVAALFVLFLVVPTLIGIIGAFTLHFYTYI